MHLVADDDRMPWLAAASGDGRPASSRSSRRTRDRGAAARASSVTSCSTTVSWIDDCAECIALHGQHLDRRIADVLQRRVAGHHRAHPAARRGSTRRTRSAFLPRAPSAPRPGSARCGDPERIVANGEASASAPLASSVVLGIIAPSVPANRSRTCTELPFRRHRWPCSLAGASASRRRESRADDLSRRRRRTVRERRLAGRRRLCDRARAARAEAHRRTPGARHRRIAVDARCRSGIDRSRRRHARARSARALDRRRRRARGASRREDRDRASRRRTLQGTLLGLDNGALIVRDDADAAQVVYVREYDTLRFAQGSGLPGSTLQLDGRRQGRRRRGDTDVSDLGPRLARRVFGAAARRRGCRMRLDALASIANRSGRDYPASKLKLVAGSPNIARRAVDASGRVQGDDGGRRRARRSAAGAILARRLSQLRDRRHARSPRCERHAGTAVRIERARLRAPLDLRERRRVVSAEANAPQGRHAGSGDAGPVTSELRFTPTENLPAGTPARADARSRRSHRIPRRSAHRRYAERSRVADRARHGVRSFGAVASAPHSASTRPRAK